MYTQKGWGGQLPNGQKSETKNTVPALILLFICIISPPITKKSWPKKSNLTFSLSQKERNTAVLKGLSLPALYFQENTASHQSWVSQCGVMQTPSVVPMINMKTCGTNSLIIKNLLKLGSFYAFYFSRQILQDNIERIFTEQP